MERLRADVAEVRSRLQSAEGPLRSLTADEGGVDMLVATHARARAVRVTAVLVEAGCYPATPALLTCDDHPEIACALAPLGQEFQDAAPVAKLVVRVLQVLGLDVGMDLESLGTVVAANESAEPDDYSSGDYEEEEEDDDLGGGWEAEEYLSDVEEDEDKEWTVELGRRQGVWEKFEEERRLSLEGDMQPGGVSLSEEVAQNRQIFDTRAAFKMLSKELLSILREQSFDLLVDAVNNDVYQWNVELAGFPPDSGLYHDISELQKKSSYSSVHLLITFKRGLHPFFPPRVEILRPRFKGAVAWAIASHPMLNLSNWDPLIRLKELIMRIKEFLVKHARVDMDSHMNSTHWHVNGGYSPAERHLARLEALCELFPRCISNPEHRNLYDSRDVFIDEDRIAALRQGDIQLKKARKDKSKGPWAAGTGFGSGHTDGDKDAEVWDARKSKAAQRARDLEMERVLIDLSKSLAAELVTCSGKSNEKYCNICENGRCPSGHAEALVQTLDESCLLPFLWREMGNASFTDVSGMRAEYYLSIMKVVKELSHPVSSSILYSTVDGGESSVSTAITNLKEQAEYYLRVMASNSTNTSGGEGCQGSVNARQANMVDQPQSPAAIGFPIRKEAAVEVEKRLGLELASLVVQVAESLNSVAEQKVSGTSLININSARASTDKDEYILEMKKNQVDFIPNLENGHLFANEAARESSFPKERMVRLAREMAGLQSLLPVNHSSSILVRVDEQKVTMWRALIFGPEDTPYSGGCFLFDIYFPTTYPQSSPKVKICTTGGGKVRFNPNLYACGKVCLSLLGTWSGGAGETWDPNASTCFQVLVSIQSLILVPDPYFNEPGFEESMNTDQGKSASCRYNQDIRENTIHRAMIDYLKCPPREFESVVLAHFKMRKQQILSTCHSWIEDAERNKPLDRNSGRLRNLIDDEGRGQSHLSRLKSLVAKLESLLDKL